MDTSRFQRLGHVELSSNEATNFKARELKSVHVDARGSYFQIFLYKNFANPENPHNQISIIALNFIGESDTSPPSNGLSDEPVAESVKNISPLDDLAFDIYQDPQLNDIIRRLECQKLEYARQENFDMAKKTRDAIRYIQEASEKICRLEVEKQEAAKIENYEEAKEKKECITQIRAEMARNIDLDALFCAGTRPQHYSRPIASNSRSMIAMKQDSQTHSVETGGDLGREQEQEFCSSDSTASSGDVFPARHWHNAADERPLPALLKRQTNNSNGGGSSHQEKRPSANQSPKSDGRDSQELPEEILRQAGIAIDVVGLPLVRKFYSRSWKLREQALLDLEKRISRDPLPPPVSIESVASEPDPVGELRSTTFLLMKTLGEQVLPVYRKALEMIKPTIVEFGERHHIAKSEIFASVDKVVRLLLQRTGDSSLRVRDITKTHLTEMGKWPLFRQGGGFWHEILRPFQPTTLERLVVCQMEIVSDIYADMTTSNAPSSCPCVEDFITFAVQALEHRSNEVRDLAESLILALYRSEDRDLVRQLMPPNDCKAQQHPLYRRIFAKFDKLDGRDQPSTVPPPPTRSGQAKRNDEIPASSQQQRRGHGRSVAKKSTSFRKSPPEPAHVVEPILPATATNNELDLLLSLDKTCIFCGEQNEEFTEEALDMHYWRACPMLRRCHNCKQVVEISGLTEHLLSECPEAGKLGGYRRCERCSEAVPNASFITHNSCRVAPNPSLRCPLCHSDLPDDGVSGSNNEESWRKHLLQECRQNSRIARPPQPTIQGQLMAAAAAIFPGKKAVVKRVNNISSYNVSNEACEQLQFHGLNAFERRQVGAAQYLDLPPLYGSNIKQHFDSIASELSKPYLKLIGQLKSLPDIPSKWQMIPGWTAYMEGSHFKVECPLEDVLVFDTEVLTTESCAPVIAVAASSNAWYLWVSPRLLSSLKPTNTVSVDDLIPFYSKQCQTSSSKCVIGHFVSYDRARILEEYLTQPTGMRFLDTMSLHICVSGLTSTQRNLKLASDKHLYNNKLWKDFVAEHNFKRGSNDAESLDWIKDASLNNLLDVYKLYCQKEPYQSKDLRSVFEKGTRREVIDKFHDMVTYCAYDVQMTFEIFQNLWKLYIERFPHPATFYGLLEMGSMYLPIDSTWVDFQERANQAYDNLNNKQRTLLQRLAEDALHRHNGPAKSYQKDPWLWDLDWSKPKKPSNKSESAQALANLPKWYRELIPKPMKDNYKSGPSLITAQMKITPKLLRLCWKGLPLHYDQTLKWGTLIPGRVPKPFGDPRYYEQNPRNGSSGQQILPGFKVIKTAAAGNEELIFPYREYLRYWEKEIEKRLGGLSSRSAFEARVEPDPRDGLLLDELRRSVEVMPLDLDIVRRLIASLKEITGEQPNEYVKPKKTAQPLYENLGELQVKGALFWQNKDRHEVANPAKWVPRNRRKKLRRSATDTVNPEIPTCWFFPLPNEAGTDMPVGSPLSKPFQIHIAAGRLHSASLDAEGEVDNTADQILRDRIQASFWQSYSKRVMTQMYVFLEKHMLPPSVQAALEEVPKDGNLRRYGAIIPQVIAAGTISRRAVEPLWLTASNAEAERLGSEIKAMVHAPPGFCLVGADVDSQEVWIASLIGDSVVGFQGGTPFGWMTLEGSKAKGTDLHTKTANLIGIKRNEAKILNYARLYGSGLEFTKHLLSKFQTNLRPEEVSVKAEKLMRTTKGQRVSVQSSEGKSETKYVWKDGTESCVFNALEAIARSPEPRTPVLGAQITRSLTPRVVKDDFLPSRINWVVQSSAVDYLHCILVLMAWLIRRYNLRARLCISIHDEVRYLCDRRCADQLALALQISNLLTRALFAFQLGMHDLPESVAYFSSVEIDTCLRKDPLNDCKTPSNPEGLEVTYGIPKGESLTVSEIIERTGGGMKPFNENEGQSSAKARQFQS
ncbi:hypothetical protein Aperf_G00000096703 [Anoplocephala perfoliata]